jgi:hypothetical protein
MPVKVAAQTPPASSAPGGETEATDEKIIDGDDKAAATPGPPPEPQPTRQQSETADASTRTHATEPANSDPVAASSPAALAQSLPPDPAESHSAWLPAFFILLLGAGIAVYYFFWHRNRLGKLIDLDELAPVGPRIPMPPPARTLPQTRPPAMPRLHSRANLHVHDDE